tara:strand:+ start:222 stop:662 length:441 start_codon:yes stop_codon:yes gene_type:complete
MAHHRQAHRRQTKDYKGLFDNGDPHMEILDTIELDGREDAWKLRQLEESYEQNTDNTLNVRRCYLTPEERSQNITSAIYKYHNSPLGKLSLRKSHLNQRLKKVSPFDKTLIKYIQNEINFICEQQVALRALKADPLHPHPDQSASI